MFPICKSPTFDLLSRTAPCTSQDVGITRLGDWVPRDVGNSAYSNLGPSTFDLCCSNSRFYFFGLGLDPVESKAE